MMFNEPKVTTFNEGSAETGTHIAADLLDIKGCYTYVTLVDYNPGSKLEEKLNTLEHKLDSIFAMLMEMRKMTSDAQAIMAMMFFFFCLFAGYALMIWASGR